MLHGLGERGFAAADGGADLAFQTGEGVGGFADAAHLVGNGAGGLTQNVDMLRHPVCRMRGVAVDDAERLLDIADAGLQNSVELRQGAVGAHNHFPQCFSEVGDAFDQRFARRIERVDHIDQPADGHFGAFFDRMAQLFCGRGGGDQHGFALLAQFGGHCRTLLLQNVEYRTALIAQLLCDHLALIAQFLGDRVALDPQVFGQALAMVAQGFGHRLALCAQRICDGLAFVLQGGCHAAALIAHGIGNGLALTFETAQNPFGNSRHLAVGGITRLGHCQRDDFAVCPDLLYQFGTAAVEDGSNFFDLVTQSGPDHFGAHIEGFDQRARTLVDGVYQTAAAVVDGGDKRTHATDHIPFHPHQTVIEGGGQIIGAGVELFGQAAGAVVHLADQRTGLFEHDLFEAVGAVFQRDADGFRTFGNRMCGFNRIGNHGFAHLLGARGQTVVDLDEDCIQTIGNRIGGFDAAGLEIGHALFDKGTGLEGLLRDQGFEHFALHIEHIREIAEAFVDPECKTAGRLLEARCDVFAAHHDLRVELFHRIDQQFGVAAEGGLQHGALLFQCRIEGRAL